MGEEVIEVILWTDNAKSTFNNIVEYLRKEWSEREVQKFVNNTFEIIPELIVSDPDVYSIWECKLNCVSCKF